MDTNYDDLDFTGDDIVEDIDGQLSLFEDHLVNRCDPINCEFCALEPSQ